MLQVNIFKDAIEEQRQLAATERAEATRAAAEKRYLDAGLTFPPDWLLSGWGGIRTEAGIAITPITAFQVNTFLTCVDLISSSVAALPLHVYERTFNDHGRASHQVAYKHPLYDLIHAEPNEEMSRHTWLKVFMVHALAWANGYSEMQRDAGGNIVALWPRNPSATRPRRYSTAIHLPANPWRPYPVNVPAYALLYETSDPIDNYDFAEMGELKDGVGRLVLAEDMLHVPGLSFDGRLGTSTTWLAREILAQSLAMVKYSSKYFAAYAKPGGILEVPQQKAEDRAETRRNWEEAQSGSNQHRTAVVPPGVKWTAISNNPRDSQATEALQHARTEVAALFHVPGRMVGDNSHASRGTTEQENQEYLSYTLAPWLNSLKQEFKRKLFPHPSVGRRPVNPFYVDFDTSDLIRASAADRTAFYASGRQWGYLNSNDIREREKMNPITDPAAEDYWKPVNMGDLDTPAGITPANTQPEAGSEKTEGDDNFEKKA